MTLTNRDVFAQDPSERDIPNLGVAKVGRPEDDDGWKTLEWELRSFVCKGEYERGLDRILEEYLKHLSQPQQPAAWVSGFYGSGKSHLMKVLEYLWLNPEFPNGQNARDLAELPASITEHLTELSTQARRVGGVWAASGTLGAGASGSVRLAFLNVVFDSADLPQDLGQARLALWMMKEDIYEAVHDHVQSAGREFADELRDMYVSPVLANALLSSGASFGDTPAEISKTLRDQFPSPPDITDDEMLEIFEDVLRQQSTDGEIPHTLVVLDEMQQYINEDNEKSLLVQNLVEKTSGGFDSRVLIVSTGQAALNANTTLQKLSDRFGVWVALADTDVETVVREVILRKKADMLSAVDEALDPLSGEIDRHLGGTKIAAKQADKDDLVADYPLLPTRRRFWEEALRRIDKAGKAGVLRTQLKMVHDAAESVVDKPLGHVIGGDYIFHVESAAMLQTGVLLKEVDELIRRLDDGTDDGRLKSRAASLVFVISQLPREGLGDIGLRPTAAFIADLLVEDLANDGPRLRRDVPLLLDELVEDGKLLKIDGEYRLQTEEGEEWTMMFNQQRTAIRDDARLMSSARNEWLLRLIDDELGGLKPLHGNAKVPRKIVRCISEDEPDADSEGIPVWIRDEWQVTESTVRNGAAQRGNEDPVVHVLLPKIDADGIRDALVVFEAAKATINQRPEPGTEGGREAKRGMESRRAEAEQRLKQLFADVAKAARIFQSGGNELTAGSLREGVEQAANNALARSFPKFAAGDHEGWATVLSKVRDGAPASDAMRSVGHTADPVGHPVCKEVLARVTGAGTLGSDVRNDLGSAPYGWPDDAVNAALVVLLADGHVRAESDAKPIGGPKELPKTQIGKAKFFKESGTPPTVEERLALGGLLVKAKVQYEKGREAAAISGLLQKLTDMASSAGGEAPLPAAPDTSTVQHLQSLAGNEQFRAIVESKKELEASIETWSAAAEAKDTRLEEWRAMLRLREHAKDLPVATGVAAEITAIESERLLLADPDPVAPIAAKLTDALRSALVEAAESAINAYDVAAEELANTDEWSNVAETDRDAIVAAARFTRPEPPSVGSDTELLAALDQQPVASWATRQQAVAAQRQEVWNQLVAKLQPKAKLVKPDSATIADEAALDAYVDGLRAQIAEHLSNGDSVVIQ